MDDERVVGADRLGLPGGARPGLRRGLGPALVEVVGAAGVGRVADVPQLGEERDVGAHGARLPAGGVALAQVGVLIVAGGKELEQRDGQYGHGHLLSRLAGG